MESDTVTYELLVTNINHFSLLRIDVSLETRETLLGHIKDGGTVPYHLCTKLINSNTSLVSTLWLTAILNDEATARINKNTDKRIFF